MENQILLFWKINVPIKLPLIPFFSIVIDQCLPQQSLENLLSAVGKKNYQGPKMDNIQGVSPKWDVSIKFNPLGFRDLYRSSSRNTVRVSGDGRHQKTKLSRHNRTNAHINSQRLCSMHRDYTGLNQMAYSIRRESGHNPTFVTHKLSPTDNNLQRKN